MGPLISIKGCVNGFQKVHVARPADNFFIEKGQSFG
jgi:hypothetical protein